MFPLTPRGVQTLSRSHTQTLRFDVLHDGKIVKRITPDDFTLIADPITAEYVPAIAGGVNVSRNQIGRDGTVTFLDVDGTLIPTDVDALFVPMIAEIRPWVGIRYWDATIGEALLGSDTEWIPLATLVITDVDATEWPKVTIGGFDRLWFLAPFTGTYSIFTATPTDQALKDLLRTMVPADRLVMNIQPTEFSTPAIAYTDGEASLDKAHTMALSMGSRLSVDPMGVFQTTPESTASDPPVMTYEKGPQSMMLRPRRTISAADAVNVIVVTGEAATGTTPRGVAEDDDPNSITYVGRVKRRPAPVINDPLMTTSAQCTSAALTAAARTFGLSDTIAVPVIPNHALASGDVLWIRDTDVGVDFPLICDGLPLPYRAADGPQNLAMRTRMIR